MYLVMIGTIDELVGKGPRRTPQRSLKASPGAPTWRLEEWRWDESFEGWITGGELTVEVLIGLDGVS